MQGESLLAEIKTREEIRELFKGKVLLFPIDKQSHDEWKTYQRIQGRIYAFCKTETFLGPSPWGVATVEQSEQIASSARAI